MTSLFMDASDLTTRSGSSDSPLKCFDCFESSMEMRSEADPNPSAGAPVTWSGLPLIQCISLGGIVERAC